MNLAAVVVFGYLSLYNLVIAYFLLRDRIYSVGIFFIFMATIIFLVLQLGVFRKNKVFIWIGLILCIPGIAAGVQSVVYVIKYHEFFSILYNILSGFCYLTAFPILIKSLKTKTPHSS